MVDSKGQVNPTTMFSHHNVLQPLDQEPNNLYSLNYLLSNTCSKQRIGAEMWNWGCNDPDHIVHRFCEQVFWKNMEDFGSTG